NKYEEAIEKSAKGRLDIKMPAHLELELENKGFDPQDARIIRDEFEKEFQKDPTFALAYLHASATVQLSIDKFLLQKGDAAKLKTAITETFTKSAQEGLADIGKIIGDTISGQKNPLAAALKDFTSVLGEGLIKIGEQMIVASTIMQAIKASLSTLFASPAAGIVEGIAAIAIG